MQGKSITNPCLLSKLRELQKNQHLTDGEMAQQLGCSRQLYQMTRTSKIALGSKILRGIIKAFPDLESEVIYFLGSNADKSSTGGALISPQLHGGAQESTWKRFLGGLVERIKKALKND